MRYIVRVRRGSRALETEFAGLADHHSGSRGRVLPLKRLRQADRSRSVAGIPTADAQRSAALRGRRPIEDNQSRRADQVAMYARRRPGLLDMEVIVRRQDESASLDQLHDQALCGPKGAGE